VARTSPELIAQAVNPNGNRLIHTENPRLRAGAFYFYFSRLCDANQQKNRKFADEMKKVLESAIYFRELVV
jgi:hypothetical protein